ncbi:molybdopterin-synthase adenylyltransferase MoeB [Legionella brunensis]|uniref:Molybdopterin-synthase adenylyltransferase n=1 Tax=Legionella brunensis TaxID=29422 RepID=A0A0W0S5J7_9GAMM|nr:molybdopterin-synthase adenylyltransferase MoeB [Legionella brunensis]KTC78361.1 sulfurylase ThiF [Legionella brunensis]
MIDHSLSADELVRYSQQIKLPDIGLSGQEKLRNARVLCIGLGGLGSPLLLYLAAAGVGRLGIVDDDLVELSNLQRQILYRQPQVGLQKSAAATAQLLALNPSIHVDSYSERLTEENASKLISQYDIVADGSDNFYTRYLIHDTCFELEKPYVYASASQFQGSCSIFYSSKGPCLRCLFPEPPDNNIIPNCAAGGVIGVLPGILGTIQASEIIKWILKIGNSLEKRLLIIDLLKMTFKEIHLYQNPDCKLCVHRQPLSKLVRPLNCQSPVNLKNYSITPEHLLELLQQNSSITLIDVRSTKEHEAHNIGGKILPLTELPHRLSELDPNQNIILYCHSGNRSISALNILLKAGFTSVKYLINGIDKIII